MFSKEEKEKKKNNYLTGEGSVSRMLDVRLDERYVTRRAESGQLKNSYPRY